MTEFNGVRRVTREAYKTAFQRRRKIVVTLNDGDVITFREHGCRLSWSLPADAAFRLAIRHRPAPDQQRL